MKTSGLKTIGLKTRRWLWLLLIALVAAGILIPVSPLYRPVPSDDPSVYLYTGQAILKGGAPYVSAWDHKQPLAYLVYALALLISPGSLWGIWLIELACLAAFGAVAFLLIEQIAPRPAAFLSVAAGLLALFTILWGYALEELALPLQAFVLYAFTRLVCAPRTKHSLAWGAAAGAAAGAAFFLKQSLVAAGLAAAAYLALEMIFTWLQRRHSWRNLSALAGMAGGFLLVAAPLLIYLWRSGALAAYRDAAFGFNLVYAQLGPLERARSVLDSLEFMSGNPGLFVAFALWIACALLALLQSGPVLAKALSSAAVRIGLINAGGALVVLSLLAEIFGRDPGFGLVQWLAILAGGALLLVGLLTSDRAVRNPLLRRLSSAPALPAGSPLILPLLWVTVLYFPALLAMLTLSGRSYVYYYIPLIPFLMLALGLTGGILLRAMGGFPASRTAASTERSSTSNATGNATGNATSNATSAEARLAAPVSALLLGLAAAISFSPALLLASGYRAQVNPPLPKIVDYVKTSTAPSDTILAWGKYITYVYFLTGRAAPTRYFYQAPVELEAYNAEHHVSAEILRDMQAHPPRLFLMYTDTKAPPPGDACPLPASAEPDSPGQVFQFVCAHYHYDVTLDEFQVYRLNQ